MTDDKQQLLAKLKKEFRATVAEIIRESMHEAWAEGYAQGRSDGWDDCDTGREIKTRTNPYKKPEKE